MTDFLQAVDESAALEMLHEAGCTDGLPVVIPTPERVEALVWPQGWTRICSWATWVLAMARPQ